MQQSDESQQLVSLGEYVQLLRRRRLWVIGSVALAVAGSLALALMQTPVYAATAELLLQQRSHETLFDAQTGQRNDPERAVKTEIRVLESQPVRERARELTPGAPRVSATPVGDTDVIAVTVVHADPAFAAKSANAYARAYIESRRNQAVDGLLEAANAIQEKVAELEAKTAALDEQSGMGPTGPAQERISTQRASLVQQQALFRQKLDQLRVDAALKEGGAHMVTAATPPQSPSQPRPLTNAVAGVLMGLIGGIAIAFLVDRLDDKLASKHDLERITTPSIPVVGLIPAHRITRRGRKSGATLFDPTSPASEAYRALRTSVQFRGLDSPVQVLQITSPEPVDGKTTTLANLAASFSQTGQRVLAMSCDLRRPRLHTVFGVDNSTGVTSILLGDIPTSMAIRGVAGTPNLKVLPSGPVPQNPAEVLGSPQMAKLLAVLRAQFDLILIDSPPVLPVTDAAVLAGVVDATLVVARAGKTTRHAWRRTLELLRQVNAPLIGAVFNGVKADAGYGYGGYGYGDSAPRSDVILPEVAPAQKRIRAVR